MQTNNSDSHIGGFSYWHLGLVAGLAALLVLVIVMKSGFSISGKKSSAPTDEKQKLTYDQVKKEVDQKLQVPQEDEALTAEAVAMLDPSNSAGEVLGASTDELSNFPSIESIISDDQLKQIQVRISTESGKSAIEKYARDTVYVETKNNVLDLFASLNSEDPAVLADSKKRAEAMVTALGGMSVPKELEDYHKYKSIYYVVLGRLAIALSDTGSKETLLSNTQFLFALIEKMERVKVEIQNKYGVSI